MTMPEGFELAPEQPSDDVDVTPKAPPSPSSAMRDPAQDRPAPGSKTPTAPTKQQLRFKARLLRFVPGFAVAFLVVAWAFVGGRYWAYLLAGSALGVFAAYRKTSENVLGVITVVVGFGTTLLVVGFVPSMMTLFLIVSFGVIGWVAGMDDRLRVN